MGRLKIGIAASVAISTALLCAVLWNFSTDEATNRQKRNDNTKADKKYMEFNDWLNGKFRSRSFYPNWVSDSEYATLNGDNEIVKKHIETGEETVLLEASAWNNVENPSGFSVSADQKYVAITYGNVVGYAHYMGTFSVAIFDTSDSSKVVIPNFPADGIQKIKWDPIGHKMAYVYDFNVYLVTDFTETPIQITNDGEENEKFNGITDWLYAVEITNDDALLWFSPNSTYLAFATIDQSNVKKFDFALYEKKTYPNMISFPYPKPGTPIPVTQTFIFNTEDPDAGFVEAVPSDTVKAWGDYYLNSAIWRGNDTFSPTWKSRFENESVSENCMDGDTSWDCAHVSEMETKSETGWVGHYKPADLVAMPNNSEYMTVISNPDGYPHLVVVNADTNEKDWRTEGTFEVTDTGSGDQAIYFYDEVNDWVYFTSTEYEGDGLPRIRHMWRIKAHGNDTNRECITCDLNTEYKDRCNWVRPSFSPQGSYVVVNCGGTGNGAPVSTLHSISASGEITFVKIVQDNVDLQQNLQDYYFRTREYGSITLPGVEGEYYYTLHKPPNFDENKKYPMLVQVYSGPGWQHAADYFSADWARGYIASSDLDVIVMTFDGRGTGYRGDKIMHMVYRRLGEYEPLDQIEAARQLSTKHDYIDESRIAIWGRSYGGYATSRTIAEDEDQVFKCGFAVAPVTDWLTYSTIYTERYMGSPNSDNEVGYEHSSAIQKLPNFGKHYFVIVHGTSDENVHFLNSGRLSKALIEEDIDFSNYFAGDETHSFTKHPNGYAHHYKLLTHHLKICFGLPS